MSFREKYAKKSEAGKPENSGKTIIDDNYYSVCELLDEIKGVLNLWRGR